ncbi:ABC transporter ATP-binding protein [Alkaliphilus transvaalensis]|uniref:ABC transporter ATP-binding protein n=1 Tax=Alkaliphilus transvaalensis TaxID=114628 RepID=UPI00047B0B9C|nr:ATP-binding cassette domain-containing protein [Alkaliphilus transvaalensis]
MIVEINNLVKRYENNIAVDHINLSIKEGDIYGLLGPNGAGKTTLINTMLCLSRINEGQIKIFGKDLYSQEEEIKKEIGIVPQDVAIYDDLTTYENLVFFGKLYGLKGNLLKNRIDETLEFIGLQDKKKAYPKKFSGGMKRRLNIGCAILHQPKLIIMDEPTVGIDPQSRNQILESVKILNEKGSTIIYTSHYMEEIEEICKTITIIDHGRVIASGTKEELKNLISFEDRITIRLAKANNNLCNEIKSIDQVKECIVEDNRLTIVSSKNSKNLGRIIDVITQQNSLIQEINLEKPTLEGVFLTLTGRTLRD